MNETGFFAKYRAEILLVGILFLAGFLNLWNIWNQGISNAYYAAAVRSMLENPSVLFFNSFDAAGFVTIDKPPVGLWVQVASAALLGFSGWVLVLPQALAGIGSVAVIYAIVSRPFGKTAGLVSAFALAITPIFVAVSRNGTMDGLLIFVLLLAVWVALKAARERSLPWLLVSVILIGIGFNIKMIQAYIVVPAVLGIYLSGTNGVSLKKRVMHLVLAVMVLLAVSLSWAVAVDIIPTDQRPYIGGSGDNTVLGLIVNYNGMHRLENGMPVPGGTRGPGVISPGNDAISPTGRDGSSFLSQIPQNRTADLRVDRVSAEAGGGPPSGGQVPQMDGAPSGSPGLFSQAGDGNGGGKMDETGTPGIFRLFGEGLAGQISWLLPFALIGLLAWWRKPASLSLKGLEDAGFFSERGLTLLGFGLWLLPGLLYFSFTTGFWHTYYLATIAPPLAALTGINAAGMYWAYREEGIRGWLLVVAVLATGLIQTLFILYNADWAGVLIHVILAGTIALAVIMTALKIHKKISIGDLEKPVAIIAIAFLFIASFVWACTPLIYGSGGILPVAGPKLSQGGPGMANGNNVIDFGDEIQKLADYLTIHNTGETWIVAVPGSNNEGANLIIKTGAPVMSLGGFSGTDQILSVDNLTALIQEGRVRYFLTPASSQGGGMFSGNDEIFTWVSSHCTVVPASDWGGNSGTGFADQNPPFGGESGNSTVLQNERELSQQGNNSPRTGSQYTLYDCASWRYQSAI
jgi:4-amino-4-deoxy-L-arabinose transferase-like glycosyltransferase